MQEKLIPLQKSSAPLSSIKDDSSLKRGWHEERPSVFLL